MRPFKRMVLLGIALGWIGFVEARSPNVVVFLSDDQGWGDLSISGNTNLSTPHIDSLGRDGAVFDRFFVCPVCSPTRAEFLTGRHHQRSGVYSTSAGGERMNLDEHTIGDAFKAAGYATGAFGKWHNGMQYPYHPNGRGFDEFYGFCSGHWGNYFSPPLEHNGKRVQGEGFVIDDFTNHAMAFMEAQKDSPFFVYLPYNTPHSPWQAPDKFYQKFDGADLEMLSVDKKKEDLEKTRCALAMCENIDWNVGRVLKKLDELGIAEDTMVLYFHDNGPNSARWNGSMKGRKGSTDEGGVRSPLLFRWPAQIKPGTKINQIASVADLLPTLADCAGIPHGAKKALDGISLKPLLLGTPTDWADRMIFNTWKGKVSIRSQQYRYDTHGKLFDMVKDPGQTKGLATELPEVAQRFAAAAKKFKEEMAEQPVRQGHDPRTYPVGFSPDFPITQLPARDAIAQGQIKRSNRFPNCSYFSNWVDVNDTIRFEIDVQTAGSYDVVMYYTCPERDLGSEMELRFKDQVVRSTVSVANDPPVRGAAEDRVPRAESYVKDFAPMALGTIHLEKGVGTLELAAAKMPGESVVEFRSLWLTYKE